MVVDFRFVDTNLLDFDLEFDAFKLFVSCIYGDPGGKPRNWCWKILSRIRVNRKEFWCMFGDFNDILHNGEKLEGLEEVMLSMVISMICRSVVK